MVNISGLNATLTAGCINAGCSIFSMPSNTTVNQENGVIAFLGQYYAPDWSFCQYDPGNSYRIRYTDPRDAALT